jgi:HSP20 family molecular chaperone IbpA
MEGKFPRDWMWSEALAMLARADRLHRELFRPTTASQQPVWEPPVDILETGHEVLVLVALPGVDADEVEAVIDGADLVIAGTRQLPPELNTAVIHRLELPQGRFERRVRLPAGRYRGVRRSAVHGCLLITLDKAEAFRG